SGARTEQGGSFRGTPTDTRINEQHESETGSDAGSDWGTDAQGTEGNLGTEMESTHQGTTEAWGTSRSDTTQNQSEGSAYPQEQNQRSEDQWGTQSERSSESE